MAWHIHYEIFTGGEHYYISAKYGNVNCCRVMREIPNNFLRDVPIYYGNYSECRKYLDKLVADNADIDLRFNEWLLVNYGITSDDMTDEDYDMWYEKYRQEVYGNEV